MYVTKHPLESKSIIGNVIAGIATLLLLTGVVEISPTEQQTLAESISTIITVVVQLGGIVLGIYGRLTAKHKLKV